VPAPESALKQARPPIAANSVREGFIMTADLEIRMQQIAEVIAQLDDPKVPRNIRKGAKEAVEKWLMNKGKELDIRIAITSAKLDELYEDPNIPMEFGVLIMQIHTALEQMLNELHS
jgi:uncharacterized protein (UPF0147 family)